MDNRETLKSSRIMIVDDQEENILLITTLLESEGYSSITSTTDSANAVKLYEQTHPDLLLLDINMPVKNGFDIMEEVSKIERDSYCPILVLTSEMEQETKLKALNSGAKDFLIKPFDKSEALCRISNMLEVRHLYNQLNGQNTLLEQKVKERTKDLYDSHIDLIKRLARAVEYRDKNTGMHIIRVSSISMLIAKKMGLDEAHCLLLRDAAMLHDIGKLGIPDSILLKPGKLDEKEWLIMQKHSLFGSDILSNAKSDILILAHTIALTHHERWDGNGYPNKLKGTDIPLEGRICAIADTFDAIISERLYKKPRPPIEAINEIRKESDRAFDPAIVEAFLDIIPEIMAAENSYK